MRRGRLRPPATRLHHGQLGELRLAALQRPRAGGAARAHQLGPHDHLRHAGRAEPRAWRDVHARRLRRVRRLQGDRILRDRGDRRHARPPRGGHGDGACGHPLLLQAAARGPAARHLRPGHRVRRGGAPHLLQRFAGGAAAEALRGHHQPALHVLSHLPARGGGHLRGGVARALPRALPHAPGPHRARGHRGFGDGRLPRHQRRSRLHGRVRHRRDGGGLRRHRERAGGVAHAGGGRGDPGADLRGGRDRRRGVVSRRDPRRPHFRRDREHHLDGRSGLRLRDAVRRHDAGPDAAAPRPARREGPRVNADRIYSPHRPGIVEVITAVALIAAPFLLQLLEAAPNTVNRILVWGLFGIGFDILFGYTGLLSFGQSAFYGTGGMVAAWLLTKAGFPHVVTALVVGMVAAAVVGYLVGLVALRRTGIYFAMITVAIAEVFYFVEFNPLSQWTGGENGLPGVPAPKVNLGFTTIHFTSG